MHARTYCFSHFNRTTCFFNLLAIISFQSVSGIKGGTPNAITHDATSIIVINAIHYLFNS